MSNDNLRIYNEVKTVPQEAQTPIKGGRLSGYTDINPMWRIKVLTEQFGPCGVGWKYEIVNKWLENGANGEIAAFVDILLYVIINGEWSEPIPGTGGSMFVAKEKNGLYTNDEAFKMATTDALSVACKALGIGADVYWAKDRTKYSMKAQTEPEPKEKQKAEQKPTAKATNENQPLTDSEKELILSYADALGINVIDILQGYKVKDLDELNREQINHLLNGLKKRMSKQVQGES